jgi:hypothetical protein
VERNLTTRLLCLRPKPITLRYGYELLLIADAYVTSIPTRRITRWAEHNLYDAALGQDICYSDTLISRIRPTGLIAA